MSEENFGKEKVKGVPETSGDGIISSSTTNRVGGKKVGAIGNTKNGAIGSNKVEKLEKAEPAKPASVPSDKVAVYSTKNVTWSGIGKLIKGYNIITKEEAKQWLTRSHVRKVEPKELAEEHGL
jgi:hypothetical protein